MSLTVLLLCQGCSKNEIPEVHALTVDSEGNTGTGIRIGSSYEDFAEAYGKYYVQKINGENFEPYEFDLPDEKKSAGAASADPDDTSSPASAPEHDGAYVVAAFYVDDEPTSVEELCASTGVAVEQLPDHLAGTEYLAEHTVIYRYIIFTIRDGIITDISSDYLDYNGEL